MKHAFKLAALLLLGAGAAGCDIGEGSTIETLEVRVQPVAPFEQGTYLDVDLPTERYHMYDCFCSNIAVIGTFTDGTLANFANRAVLTSSDPAVVEVLNYPDTDLDACPAGQQAAGMVMPRGVGTATITAAFAGLSASMTVEVADSSAGVYTMTAAKPYEPATDVAVGALLPLNVDLTLDGRKRNINRNVMKWAFDNDDPELATVDSTGVLGGVGRTGAVPRVVRASFGTCTDVSVSSPVNVGDVVKPLLLEREPGFAADSLVAVATDQQLKTTAGLDFDGDGDADGTQLFSSQVLVTFTEACTLREFDDTNPPGNCRETVAECSNAIAICDEATATSCPSDMSACRVNPPSFLLLSGSTAVAAADNNQPTNFTATFPASRGAPTTLSAALDGVATTLTVTALSGYPTTLPWFAEIDAATGAREVVRVTAIDGETLTVVRGVGDTAAVPHAAGATFAMRAYNSDPVTVGDPPKLPLTAHASELIAVAIDPPGTLDALGTLQLRAIGTFEDAVPSTRTQNVSRLTTIFPDDFPSVVWISSDLSVGVTLDGGLATSTNACGGRASVRARSTDGDTAAAAFDADTTDDDVACANDPLCDQVELCVATPSPLPLGQVCETTTTCP